MYLNSEHNVCNVNEQQLRGLFSMVFPLRKRVSVVMV